MSESTREEGVENTPDWFTYSDPFAYQTDAIDMFVRDAQGNLVHEGMSPGMVYRMTNNLQPLFLEGGHSWAAPTPDQLQEQLRSRGRTGQAELAKKLDTLIDINLDIRKLLAEVLEIAQRRTGAIHTLNEGKVRLVQPVRYSFQDFGDEVLVGIEEVGVYGVGTTEHEAVLELQEELWALYQELESIPEQELGPELKSEKRILRGWIGNGLDA